MGGKPYDNCDRMFCNHEKRVGRCMHIAELMSFSTGSFVSFQKKNENELGPDMNFIDIFVIMGMFDIHVWSFS